MKHTLKSLLITSVLTVPSIFASGDALPKQDEERVVGAQPAVTEDIVITSRPEETEAMLLSFCHRADTTAFGIMYAAWIMKLLGPECKGTAADLYERGARHPIVHVGDITYAARELTRLGSELNGRAAALFELAANHPSATHDEIEHIVRNMNDMGFYKRAKALWERAEERKLQEAAQKNEN